MNKLTMAIVLVAAVGAGCAATKSASKAAAVVQLEGDQIKVNETIAFETGKAVIDPASHGLLDSVADILKTTPAITKLTIEGHTDASGDAGFNKQLSQDRADAVKAYIVGKGIEAERLAAVGYGSEQPVASNDTEEDRAKNRRVEFKVAR